MENIHKPKTIKKKKKKKKKKEHILMSPTSAQKMNKNTNWKAAAFQNTLYKESKEETPIISLSPFIIEKILTANISPNMVKKLKNGTLLIQIKKKKHADFLLKSKSIPTQNIKQIQRRSKKCRTITLFYRRNRKRIKNQSVLEAKRINPGEIINP